MINFKKDLLIITLFFALIPVVFAYNAQIQINSNVADFHTDIYKCTNSGCNNINYYSLSNTGTTQNSYTLSGSGDNYYMEYDYKSCYKPHMYRMHMWGDVKGSYPYSIDFTKKSGCAGTINNLEVSADNITIGGTIIITASIHSVFEYPSGIPTTTAIPLNIQDEYSSKTKVTFYANNDQINQTEEEILLASDKNFTFNWTPTSPGIYTIEIVSEVTDCACSSQDNQTDYIIVKVACIDADGDGYNATGGSCGSVDCDDNNTIVYPGANELCNGKDDDCDGEIDEGADMLCDDGLFCNGQEACVGGSCQLGTPIDCSANDLPPIATCNNDPDNNPFTWDYFEGFTSVCDEDKDGCTVGVGITHDLIVGQCGVECVSDDGCNSLDGDDYCDGDIIKHEEGECVNFECVAETQEVEDCSQRDGVVNECGLKEWTCTEQIDGPVCVSGDTEAEDDLCPDFCQGDIRNGGFCNPLNYNCVYTTEDCNEYDNYYCSGNVVKYNDYKCEIINTSDWWLPLPPEFDNEAYCATHGSEVVESCDYGCFEGDCITCPDPNGDGFVDIFDLGIVNQNYGREDCAGPDWCNGADVNRDGKVDIFDLSAVQSWYGNVCGEAECVDMDNDGHYIMSLNCPTGDDCNDNDNTVYPGAPALCDGKDNNCDGILGYAEVDDDGDGYMVCEEDCDDANVAIHPGADELCDGIDNDCDGTVDDGCACMPRAKRDCAKQEGVCQGLQETCNDQGQWPGCDYSTIPDYSTTDNCDNKDNDCDGITDEDYVETQTTCGIGACQANGLLQCVAGAEVDSCTPGQPAANDATCDGIDDDCDGTNDEDYALQPTTCGIGACYATGQTSCVAGSVKDSCTPGAPSQEVCEGSVDEDCDGKLDEDCECTFGQKRNCAKQDGVCAGSQETCDAEGKWPGCDYSLIPYYENTESSCSDLRDNDCDSLTDINDSNCIECYDSDNDGYYAISPSCPSGNDCDDADSSIHPNAEEISDSRDNDCDGSIDEGIIIKKLLDKLPRQKFFISQIRTNQMVYDTIHAGDQLFIDLRFENIGRYNTKDATIRVTIPELGISRKLGPFNGPEVDEVMSKGLYLDIPEDAKPGVYTARISLSDLSGIRRTRHRDFRIVEQ